MSGGLTTIKNTEDYMPINYRPFPVDRLNTNVGERPIFGIPYLRKGMTPYDSASKLSRSMALSRGVQDSNSRLGEQLPSLPARMYKEKQEGGMECQCENPVVQEGSGNCMCEQCGGNAMKRLGRFVKGIAKKTKGVSKFVKGVAKVVKPIADVGAKIASVVKPELAGTFEAVSKGAEATEKAASKVQKKSRNLQRTARKVQREGRKEEAEEEQEGGEESRLDRVFNSVRGNTRGIGGTSQLTYNPLTPLNFRKASLADLR